MPSTTEGDNEGASLVTEASFVSFSVPSSASSSSFSSSSFSFRCFNSVIFVGSPANMAALRVSVGMVGESPAVRAVCSEPNSK